MNLYIRESTEVRSFVAPASSINNSNWMIMMMQEKSVDRCSALRSIHGACINPSRSSSVKNSTVLNIIFIARGPIGRENRHHAASFQCTECSRHREKERERERKSEREVSDHPANNLQRIVDTKVQVLMTATGNRSAVAAASSAAAVAAGALTCCS
jgi:hypothetical protein